MAKTNTATWTKTARGWQLLVNFTRHWEAPGVGEGLDTLHTVVVHKRGDRNGGTPTEVRLTSRVFARDGKHLAFAEEAK